MNSYYNFEIGEEIICPYCGRTYKPSYEDTYIGKKPVKCYEEKQQEFVCDNCNKRFVLLPVLCWHYETSTIDGQMSNKEYEKKFDIL